MIFVLLGRRNALCLARHNRAKNAEISRFQAGSDLSLYPIIVNIPHRNKENFLALQKYCGIIP